MSGLVFTRELLGAVRGLRLGDCCGLVTRNATKQFRSDIIDGAISVNPDDQNVTDDSACDSACDERGDCLEQIGAADRHLVAFGAQS